jgi:hypothetical protein
MPDAHVNRCQAREGPLVGGARSTGRVGVRDGLQARRGGGGATARGVTGDGRGSRGEVRRGCCAPA